MGTANRVIKNTGFLYAKMGITMFISLYTTRLVLNALGDSDYGIFNVVGGAIAMLGFLHLAMSSATQRFMSYYEGKGDPEKQKQIFNVSLVLHFGIALILAIVLIVAGFFFFNGILNIPEDRIFAAKVIYGALILSTVFTVIAVPYEAVLNAHENMLYYSVVGVIESLLKLSVALIIVRYGGDKLVLYGILMALIPFVIRTIMQLYCHRKYTECLIAPRRYFEKTLMNEMTSFAGWNFLGTASSMISNYGSAIILNRFFGTVLNAANGITGQLNGQMLAFSNNMLKAVNPLIVKNEGGGNRNSMYQVTFWACKMSALIYALFAIPFFIEADFVLKLWLIHIPPYTIIFIKILILQVFVEQLTLPLETSIGAIGNIKQFNTVKSIIFLFFIILVYALFKMGLPPQSMQYAGLFIASLLAAYLIFYSVRYANMSINVYITKVIFKTSTVIALSLAIGSLFHYLISNDWLRLIAVILSSALTLLTSFLYLDLNANHRNIIYSNIKNLIRQKFFK